VLRVRPNRRERCFSRAFVRTAAEHSPSVVPSWCQYHHVRETQTAHLIQTKRVSRPYQGCFTIASAGTLVHFEKPHDIRPAYMQTLWILSCVRRGNNRSLVESVYPCVRCGLSAVTKFRALRRAQVDEGQPTPDIESVQPLIATRLIQLAKN
jgi:hypothetical protein